MIWRIRKFSRGPHWDIAFVEAKDEYEARHKLFDFLKECNRVDMKKWEVTEEVRPMFFVMEVSNGGNG